MLHGDDVILSETGIQVPAKEVFPLGILNGSHCYGVFRHASRARAPAESALKEHHLVITPVPPDAWPVCFRLRVRLVNQPGSLASITAVLKQLQCNILFAESGIAGTSHAVLNLTCEALPLKGWAEQQRRSYVPPPAGAGVENKPPYLEAICHLAGCRLYAYMHRVAWIVRACGIVRREEAAAHAAMLDADAALLAKEVRRIQLTTEHDEHVLSPQESFQGYLDSRFLYGRHLLLNYSEAAVRSLRLADCDQLKRDLDNLGPDGRALFAGRWVPDEQGVISSGGSMSIQDLTRVMRREGYVHGSPAVYPTFMPTLLELWLNESKDRECLDFEYNASTNRLRITGESGFRILDIYKSLALPQRAPALVSTREDLIYVVAQTKDAPNRRSQIRVEYHARLEGGTETAPASTRGYCSTMAAILKDHLNVDQLTSRLTKRPRQHTATAPLEEQGVFEFSGRCIPQNDRIDSAKLKSSLEDDFKKANPNVRLTASVSDLSAYSVFISTIFGTPVWKKGKDKIERVCREHGFEPLILDSRIPSTGDITSAIMDKISVCDAFVQILGVDSHSRAQIPEKKFVWITAEYAIARALGRPTSRLVESSEGRIDAGRWAKELKIDPGWPMFAFADLDELLEATLPSELAKMMSTLAGQAGASRIRRNSPASVP